MFPLTKNDHAVLVGQDAASSCGRVPSSCFLRPVYPPDSPFLGVPHGRSHTGRDACLRARVRQLSPVPVCLDRRTPAQAAELQLPGLGKPRGFEVSLDLAPSGPRDAVDLHDCCRLPSESDAAFRGGCGLFLGAGLLQQREGPPGSRVDAAEFEAHMGKALIRRVSPYRSNK